VSVDGTDFQIIEPSPFDEDNYSYKFNGPGLRYEVGVCILSGEIVWANGPYEPGKWNDLEIFRLHMKHALRPWERVEGDKGYKAECPQTVKTHIVQTKPEEYMRKCVMACD
jgi:hypothetical protein